MRKHRVLAVGALISFSTALMTACGVAPIDKDQAVTLAPNEGIAAIVMYSLDPLKQISINSTDKGGQTLKIPYVPAGTTLNVFATPAGTYCVAEYYFQFIRITLNDQKHGVCFDVIPGKIAYSGNITPSADSPNDIETYQTYDWKGFEAKLKSEYPTLAAQYPIVKP